MKFDAMLTRAKTVDYLRDRQRSERASKDVRYEALAFPAYHGSPVMTNSFIVAWAYSFLRSFSYAEVRIIDHKTGKHFVL